MTIPLHRCPACDAPVDPLRAGHVALIGGSFHYFCNPTCRQRYIDSEQLQERMLAETAEPPRVALRAPSTESVKDAPSSARAPAAPAPVLLTPLSRRGMSTPPAAASRDLSTPPAAASRDLATPPQDLPPPAASAERKPASTSAPLAALDVPMHEGNAPPASARLVSTPLRLPVEDDSGASLAEASQPEEDDDPLAPVVDVVPTPRSLVRISLGVFVGALALVGASAAGLGTRGLHVAAGATALSLVLEGYLAFGVSHGLRRGRVVAFLPLLGLVVLATTAAVFGAPGSRLALPAAALSVFAHTVVRMLGARLADEPLHAALDLTKLLHEPATVEIDHGRGRLRVERIAAAEVQAGQVVVVDEGEVCPVDGHVLEGQAQLALPLALDTATRAVAAGDGVLAGCRVEQGRLRVLTELAGAERRAARSALQGSLFSLWPKRYTAALRLFVLGALLASVVVALFAWVSRDEPFVPVALGLSVATAFGLLYRTDLPRLVWARAVLRCLRRGVVFADFAAFDRASFVEQLVLPGRGILLAGIPSLVGALRVARRESVEPVDRGELEDEILALAAAAERVSSHPLARAVVREADVHRKLAPVRLQSVQETPGLGVVAETEQGDRVVIGSRALMLREAVSIAAVEAQVAVLEAEGKELLYHAQNGRLVALLLFEDRLREGAFAAVQSLTAAKIEPVLLSGVSRELCESFARTLEIEHVRAEVLPDERAAVLRSLTESGRVVGMLGALPADEEALQHADVAMALAGRSKPLLGVGRVLGEDLQAAALAFVEAKHSRETIAEMLLISTAPLLASALVAGFGLVTPALVPVAALAGLALAVGRGHRTMGRDTA